jgi:hypothetical protein
MPDRTRLRAKATLRVLMAAALAGMAACVTQGKAPEILTGTEAQVVVVADLDSSPKPLADSHCAQYRRQPVLRDTAPAAGNLLRGWATGTKVFLYTFDCR